MVVLEGEEGGRETKGEAEREDGGRRRVRGGRSGGSGGGFVEGGVVGKVEWGNDGNTAPRGPTAVQGRQGTEKG